MTTASIDQPRLSKSAWRQRDPVRTGLIAVVVLACASIAVLLVTILWLSFIEGAPGDPELGYTVAAEAAHLDEALEATRSADFDLAILDVNLDGQPISAVVDALVARGTPFVFATGYGERGLPEPYRGRPILKKPFQIEGLKQMLETALVGS